MSKEICLLNQFLKFFLILFFALQARFLPALGSTLSFSTPTQVDICKPDTYRLNFFSSTEAGDLFAQVQVPMDFRHDGVSKIIFRGRETFCQPQLSGESLRWDIGVALKSCRNIVINEWEQNPEGTDTGKEWIELYNPTSQAVNLGGWKLEDDYYEKTVLIPVGTIIAPGGYMVLTWTNGSLINSYLTKITLFDSAGSSVDCTSEAKDEKNDNLCWARDVLRY